MSTRPLGLRRSPGLARAFSGAIAEDLSIALERVGLRRSGASPLLVERGWPLAKVPLVLRCADPEIQAKDRRWWSFFILGSERIPFACRLALEQGRAVYLSDLHAVVQSFPQDLLLSNMGQAVAKKTALPVLREALGDRQGLWQSLTVRVLSYKPSRRLTLRFRLSGEHGRGKTIFAKLFSAEVDDEAVRIQRALEEATRHDGLGRITIPRLVGRVASWKALLWRRVSDPSLFELLPTLRAQEAVSRAAASLARLHGSSIEWKRVHDREREQATVRSWIEAAKLMRGVDELDLGGAFEHFVASAPVTDPSGLVPSHRDFYDKQIMMGDRQDTVLDLELACLAERELDVGNFLAHLRLRSAQGRMQDHGRLVETFMDAYLSSGQRLDIDRQRWYLAGSLLRLACVYAMRPEWEGLTPELIRACNDALEGEFLLAGSSC